ncbi:MAG: hypothetical protein IT159_14290 [Bryobacterales bacterium]|nr:hypothetical protein [Bryobacterales bacterium]
MANQGKHPKDPIQEWILGEEGDVPTSTRGAHVVGGYIKRGKPALKKARKPAAPETPAKPEPALIRESSPPHKTEAKPSQAASWEHQRRLERLSQLRAPHSRGH